MDINSVFDNVFEVNPVSDFDTSFMDLLIENEAQIVIDAKKTPAQPGVFLASITIISWVK
jgi:hypothetical protein